MSEIDVPYHDNFKDLDIPGFRGQIPFALYADLQNMIPQGRETDAEWLWRVKNQIGEQLAQGMFRTPEFRSQLSEATTRRKLAQAGATRTGQTTPGLALRALPADVGANASKSLRAYNARTGISDGDHEIGPVPTEIAQEYRNDHMPGGGVFSHAPEAYAQLCEEFNATTPCDGSIFWSGINVMQLVKLVSQWNKEQCGPLFGQLETTTEFRYVNNQFTHIRGDVYSQFTTYSSDLLADNVSGHITAITQFGLRPNSTFHDTELPRMLQRMSDSILKNADPRVTDVTIVVIEPKDLPSQNIMVYTNESIATIPLVRAPNNKSIKARDKCDIVGVFQIPAEVRNYWHRRGQVAPSNASVKLLQSFSELIKT